MSERVRLLRRRDIDVGRWDAAVASDAEPLPYGLSWWLDATSPRGWNGLVLGNYEAVLPLAFRFHFGPLGWVARPPFTQQLGPFGQFSPARIGEFLDRIPRGYFAPGYALRHGLQSDGFPPRFSPSVRTNLVLDLGASNSARRAGYSKNVRRDLRQQGGVVLHTIAPADLLANYRMHLGEQVGLKPHHYTILTNLIRACLERGVGRCYRAGDAAGGELLGVLFQVRWRGRQINLLTASTPLGKKTAGMARALDAVFEEARAAGVQLFDFEGSELPGVARFFRRFGAVERNYSLVRWKM